MQIVRHIDLRRAKEVLALANTPLYVLRNLRADSSVAAFARVTPVEDLLQSFEDAVKEPPTLENLALTFVLIVALSFKGSRAVDAASAALPLDAHPWLSVVLDALQHMITETDVFVVESKRGTYQQSSTKVTPGASTTVSVILSTEKSAQ